MQAIAISGGKGGVGKTNIAVNLSVALAHSNLDVVLLDADLGLANVDVLMGLKVDKSLADVVEGEKSLREIVVKSSDGVTVIPASSGISSMANLSAEIRSNLIEQISTELVTPDVLVVDTGAGIDETVQTFAAACHKVIVVVCDEPASLTDAYALIKVLSVSRRITDFHILVNQSEDEFKSKQVFERLTLVASKYLDVKLTYLGAVPVDVYLRQAVRERRPLVTAYPRSPAAQALNRVAKKILDTELETLPLASGLAFFFEKMLETKSSEVSHE